MPPPTTRRSSSDSLDDGFSVEFGRWREILDWTLHADGTAQRLDDRQPEALPIALVALDGTGGNVVMAEADPKAYKELGRIRPLGGQSWTAPIIADGKLIVRNQKDMVCLDLM